MDSIINMLIEKGSLAAIMGATIYVLIKKILSQYEKRIDKCEEENKECRNDRKELHCKIEKIQQDRIDDLLSAIGGGS